MLPLFKNLIEMAVVRAEEKGHKPLMTFLGEDGARDALLTYKGLDASARSIAAMLLDQGLRGQNVLLLYAPGLEYIKGFFGCLYAGAIPVPAYPPMGARDLERLANVARDCDAAAILSTASLAPMIQAWLSNPGNGMRLPCLATDSADEQVLDTQALFDAAPSAIAFLQYTSGSTGQPKGVMVSHANLLANFEQILASFAQDKSRDEISENFRTVIWLPPFHDMGLIGGVLTPVYAAASVSLMSPLTFLKNPFLWLKAISDDKALVSGGPNFSYQYCVRKISEAQKQQLDLSSWKVAFNGAEAINADSLRSFARYFADCGFDARAFLPCYGLAEATLFVSGSPNGRGALVQEVPLQGERTEALSQGVAVVVQEASCEDNTEGRETLTTLVSSGPRAAYSDLRIVDPNTCVPVRDGSVGEIWVDSPSVCSGYWKKPSLSESVFRAKAVGIEDKRYLRTGDLGFLWNNELYVTGRIKELIIIAGRNHYPQDIETTVQSLSPGMRKGCGAAFSTRVNGKEQVVIVQEYAPTPGENTHYPSLVLSVIKAVSQRHGIGLNALLLIRPSMLPKTSSGKIQRTEAKRLYENDQLDCLHRWNNVQKINVIPSGRDSRRSLEVFTDWSAELYTQMQTWVADKLNVQSQHVQLEVTFSELGIDSIEAVDVVDRLQHYLGRPLHATEMLRYPTVKALLDHIAEELQARQVAEANLLHASSPPEPTGHDTRVKKINIS